jgi:ABC-2 type transport system permease protein
MAGIEGAGMSGGGSSGPEGQGPEKIQAGAFGLMARAQYAAMARLRWHMFTNGLRFRKGALELGVRTLGYLVYGCTGLGLCAGVSVASYLLVSNNKWPFVPILFWGVFLIWQMVPVMMASFQEQFDLGILLRFPVSFGSYFLLYTVFGLADVSTILGGLCCLGIWIGTTLALPGLFLWTTLALGVFAVFNILLVRAIFAWIDRWLAQRKTREILTAVFLVLALSMQLLNPALHNFPKRHPTRASQNQRVDDFNKMQAQYGPWLKTANAVQRWLPPGLAEFSMREAAGQQSGEALGSLGMLGLFTLAAGGVLATRLRAEYRGENLGHAPGRSKKAPKRNREPATAAASARPTDAGWLGKGSGPIFAVMGKELRTLMRSVPQLYVLGAPLLMVFIFGSMFRSNGVAGHTFAFALPLCMAYSMLGFTQLFSNNLGAEGAGVQLIFLSPTPIHTVLLAKNLFHAMVFCVDVLLAGILVCLRLGPPNGAVLAGTIGWVLFALPVNLAVGNVFSITMPYRVNLGRLTRQRGSQANALLSLLAQLGVVCVGAVVFGICWYFDKLWLAAPIFLVLACAAVFTWLRMLRNADAMANRRRDSLIETLVKTA